MVNDQTAIYATRDRTINGMNIDRNQEIQKEGKRTNDTDKMA